MSKNIAEYLHIVNTLAAELETIYHQAALKVGLTDSAMLVLYHLLDNGGSCLLNNISKETGVSKQTINSAIRALEKDEIIYLSASSGRFKTVHLTEKGKLHAENTVAKIFTAEANSYANWSEDEITTYVRLFQKYVNSLQNEVNKL